LYTRRKPDVFGSHASSTNGLGLIYAIWDCFNAQVAAIEKSSSCAVAGAQYYSHDVHMIQLHFAIRATSAMLTQALQLQD
jgi:hypothetical protein